jgi:hypothetical protein
MIALPPASAERSAYVARRQDSSVLRAVSRRRVMLCVWLHFGCLAGFALKCVQREPWRCSIRSNGTAGRTGGRCPNGLLCLPTKAPAGKTAPIAARCDRLHRCAPGFLVSGVWKTSGSAANVAENRSRHFRDHVDEFPSVPRPDRNSSSKAFADVIPTSRQRRCREHLASEHA